MIKMLAPMDAGEWIRLAECRATMLAEPDSCQLAVGLFSTCSMMSVSIGAFRESSFRPTFSMAAKTFQ